MNEPETCDVCGCYVGVCPESTDEEHLAYLQWEEESGAERLGVSKKKEEVVVKR